MIKASLCARSLILYLVLGINDQEAAKRLAHTLLADPLTEEAEWERILKEVRYDRKALLIRYCVSPRGETRVNKVQIWR